MYYNQRKELRSESIMENKAIVFTAKDTAELLSAPMPELCPGSVIVELAVSTVSSGTERANLTGEENVNMAEHVPVTFPRYAGYSSSGTVIAAADDVTDFTVGDRVAVEWSTHRKYLRILTKNLTKIPDNISFEEAALWHIGTFPLAAIRKCRLEIGESAIVMGLGVLGRFAVSLLHASGAVPVIAVDPVPEKRDQALRFGADYALDPFDPDFAKKAKELTGGGVKVAIEVTGNGKAFDQVLDCMARFGRVALLGCTRHSDFTIDYYRKIHGPGITVIGAHTMARPEAESHGGWWTQRDDMKALLRLAEFNRLHLSDMIEETHTPYETPEVYTRLATEKSFPLVQFDWRKL